MAPGELNDSEQHVMVPLFADKRGTTIASMKWDKGAVIIMAGSCSLSNAGIGRGDNLNIVLNMLNYRNSGEKPVVTFDEYHHGYGAEEGIMSLISLPARLGLATLGLAFLLLLFATSRRFGRIVPLMEGARQRGEYLGSMAALLRKANATDIAREELGRRFIADVAHSVGLSPSVGIPEIMLAVQERYPKRASEIGELCSAATGSGKKTSEGNLLSLAKKWHKMRKELTK